MSESSQPNRPVRHHEPKLTLPCAVCSEPVTGATGYIHCEVGRVSAYRKAVAEWEAAHPGPLTVATAWENYPARPRWVIHHAGCDPDPEHGCYWIEADRADTATKILAWTAHLMGKEWFHDTDWDQLIYRVIGHRDV